MASGLDLLRVAESQKGICESPSGSNKVKYSRWYGLIGPWCDMFVSWCAAQIGASNIIGKYAYCPSHVNYFKRKGWWLSAEAKPQPGDIIFFASHGTPCHVGIVKRRNGSYSVTTIEGNTSVSNQDNGGKVMERTRTYGNPNGSWGILGFARPNYSGATGKVTVTTKQKSRNYLTKGDKGSNVKQLQQRLIALGYSCGKSGADGDYGKDTVAAVKRFQQVQKLEVDGVAGVNTIARLNKLYSAKQSGKKTTTTTTSGKYDAWTASLQKECNRQGYSRQKVDGVAGPITLKGCPTVKIGAKGNITKLIQQRLNSFGFSCGTADGIFGNNTRNAVMRLQRNYGLAQDGIVGQNTWRKLLRM